MSVASTADVVLVVDVVDVVDDVVVVEVTIYELQNALALEAN